MSPARKLTTTIAHQGSLAQSTERHREQCAYPHDSAAAAPRVNLRQVAPVMPIHSQPFANPARRSPPTTYGHARINRQRKSERWFSHISTTGPRLMPK
jgi:hypothetical protein